MADKKTPTIVVKRIKKVSGGAHGGAWKIAYADFVTAMMAFFLLMWLLGSVDGDKLKGISEYFQTPLKTSLLGGPSSGASNIMIAGGGRDLMQQGMRAGDGPSPVRQSKSSGQEEVKEQAEKSKMQEMKQKLEALIEDSPKLKPFKKQLLLDVSSEGLRVQIVDEQNRPMFALASPTLQPYAQDILREIAPVLNGMPNRISLAGHTDATPYAGGGKSYSNWELSADRANTARRVLVGGGLDESRLIRVIGLASAVLLEPDEPHNPTNRRISIILLNKRAEDAAINEGRLKTITLGNS